MLFFPSSNDFVLMHVSRMTEKHSARPTTNEKWKNGVPQRRRKSVVSRRKPKTRGLPSSEPSRQSRLHKDKPPSNDEQKRSGRLSSRHDLRVAWRSTSALPPRLRQMLPGMTLGLCLRCRCIRRVIGLQCHISIRPNLQNAISRRTTRISRYEPLDRSPRGTFSKPRILSNEEGRARPKRLQKAHLAQLWRWHLLFVCQRCRRMLRPINSPQDISQPRPPLHRLRHLPC